MSSGFSAPGSEHGDGTGVPRPVRDNKEDPGRCGGEPTTYAIPVLDLENVQLEAVRAGAGELGAVQVVNHGVPEDLSGDLARRMARLACPHPHRR